MSYSDLSGDQARQTIDAEQVFAAYESAKAEFDRRYRGSMAWKTVEGREYLYRKRRGSWKSLGPRSPQAEAIHFEFHAGRDRLRDGIAGLAARLDEMAPVNRALRIGRVPVIAARVLRALSDVRLAGQIVGVVGTNALYAYERLSGVQIAGAQLATGDIDLLYDARASLKLVAPEAAATGIMGQLRKADGSFSIVGKSGFRAANRDGYMVDLITPAGKDPIRPALRSRIGTEPDDLEAVEIQGLAWLVNSPRSAVSVIDAHGYPLRMWVPDPRAFALHKAWLSERSDRDPLKRQRDAAQADLVATLVRTRLTSLRFDDPALAALPRALRDRAERLGAQPDGGGAGERSLEPGW